MSKRNIDSILNECCNLYGSPLSVTVRMKIKEFLIKPTVENWDKIYGIIIYNKPLINIWTAVNEHNPYIDVVGKTYELNNENWELARNWIDIPSPLDVVVAIKKSIEHYKNNNMMNRANSKSHKFQRL